ncbi:krev interaction trapped protein 1-like [Mytilus edulis]|uniref:krev interaction trapped protein 1-like n=1 Tax=Mytilus edulis TaxID=6550 RepID=UPI0039F0882E
MEVILAVLRPRHNVGSHDFKLKGGILEYKPKLYDILLFDSTKNHEPRPTKYLPAFPLTNSEEEPRDEVLTNLYQLTGGDKHGGIKGERGLLIPWKRQAERDSLSSFYVYCIPVNYRDKLNAVFVDKSPDKPGFYSLENVIDSINNRSISFPPPTRKFISHLESWLKEKHARPETLDILFHSRADYRIKFSVSNPAFLPTRLPLSDNQELQNTAHEALAKMLAIEKCEIVVINPLFNSGLPYKTKVDKMKNLYWGSQEDQSVSSRRTSSSTNSSDVMYPSPSRSMSGYLLHKYAKEGNLIGLKEYIHHRDFTDKDDRGFAPIHWAAECGFGDVVKFLLEYGCSPNLETHQHSTPLHLAVEKGHVQVVEVLLSYPDTNVNALDSSGQTAFDKCDPYSYNEHKNISVMLKTAINKLSQITIYIMDGTKKILKLPSGSETTVEQLNRQLLRECNMPEKPYGDIFTIWICSESLELQLKPDHKPVEQMENWRHKILRQLTEGDPTKEDPKLKWRRNAKTGIMDERTITHPAAIHLLFHEAYKNYITALYPCKDQDVLNFAVIIILMKQDGVYNTSTAKAFLSKNLQSMVPEQMMKGKSHAWSNNVFRHYKDVGKSMLEGPSHVQVDMILKQQFLKFCRNLTVYGSAFFTGTLLVPQVKGSMCHIGVNDVGIHVINSQTRVMLHSFKYSEISCKLPEANRLEVNVIRFESRTDRNIPRQLTIRTKQAGLIERLIEKLSEIHAVKDRQVEIRYGGMNS